MWKRWCVLRNFEVSKVFSASVTGGGARRWFWEGIRWLNSSLRPLPRDSGREPSNSRWPEARKTWDLAYDKAKNLGFVCGFGWEKPRIVLKEKKTCLGWKKKNCLKDVEGNSYREDWSSSTKDIEFSRSKWGADQLLYSDSSRCFRDLVRNSNGLVSS